jgi:threonine 3-dehydrogenase
MSVLVEQGLDLRPVITHRFPASAYLEAFATVREGHCGKVILDWEA